MNGNMTWQICCKSGIIKRKRINKNARIVSENRFSFNTTNFCQGVNEEPVNHRNVIKENKTVNINIVFAQEKVIFVKFVNVQEWYSKYA